MQNPREVMTVPRARDQLQQAAERWLDEMNPAALNAPEADATALRRLGAAVRASADNEHDLADAVAAARRSGHPWRQIATVLGTSRQAAQQKYGDSAAAASQVASTGESSR